MDVERAPTKRKVSPNLPLGIFLKSVHFINAECTKFIACGLFQHTGFGLGLLVQASRGKFVFFDHQQLDALSVHLKVITAALGDKGTCKFNLTLGDVIVRNLFGKRYVQLYDGQHSMTLNGEEWKLLEESMPLVSRRVAQLFYIESELRAYIIEILASDELVSSTLPEADRLYDEVTLFKKHAKGGGGSS